MELLLEAIIFRYSATLPSYIWTCLALFAAALSLWRVGFLGSGSGSASEPPATTSPVPDAAVASTPAIVPLAIVTLAMLDCRDRVESESSTKGDFTAYFFAEEETGGGDESEEWVSGGFSSGVECLECLDWGWRGDLGWYTYQDRTAINGSVVKLWDGGRRRFAVAPAITEQWN